MTRVPIKTAKRGTSRALHQIILKTKKGTIVDHKNCNGLDNRRCNLRPSDKSKNGMNRGTPCNNTSGYKGVSISKNGNWIAQLQVRGKTIRLGTHRSKIKAAKIYNAAVIKYHGEFAKPNKI